MVKVSLMTAASLSCVVGFCVLLLVEEDLALLWVFLELATFGLVPCYFSKSNEVSYSALFSYMLVNGLSSAFLIAGCLSDQMFMLFYWGLFVKFGLGPFLVWIYSAAACSNWLVIWGISVPLKSSFLVFTFFLNAGGSFTVAEVCCGLSLVVAGAMFWLYTPNWRFLWCHMMIGSTAVLVAISIKVNMSVATELYSVYAVWSTLTIAILSYYEKREVRSMGSFFVLSLITLTNPGSIMLWYKLLASFWVYSCSFWVFFAWICYSISEQLFLIKFLLRLSYPRLKREKVQKGSKPVWNRVV